MAITLAELEALLRENPQSALDIALQAGRGSEAGDSVGGDCGGADSVGGAAVSRAMAYGIAAFAALELGDPDLAFELGAKGLGIKPTDRRARARLLSAQGIARFQTGSYAEAIAVLEQALRDARRLGEPLAVAKGLGNLGIAYLEAGRADKAINYLAEASERASAGGAAAPTKATIALRLAEAYLQTGRYDEMASALDAAEADAAEAPTLIAELSIVRGELAERRGMRRESEEAYAQALSLAQKAGFTMIGLKAATRYARRLIDDGMLDEAEALAEDWLPQASVGDVRRYAELLRLRGRIRALRGRYREAYEDAERATGLERRPGSPSAAEATLAMERGSLRRRAKRLSEQVEGWAEAVTRALADLIEARDEGTGRHVERTGAIVLAVGERLIAAGEIKGINARSLELIARMAPLHDIGKVAVPDAVLRKPGPLDPEEAALMRTHAALGRDIFLEAAKRVRYDPRVVFAADIAGYHHERWDGSGYPEGLAGADIPLAARLVALADVYDAIRSERPYKPARSRAEAAAYVLDNAGRHFDPAAVAAFAECEARIASWYDDE